MGKILPGVETRFRGLKMSGGVALGVACLASDERHDSLPVYRVSSEEEQRKEIERLENATQVAAQRLDAFYQEVTTRIGKAEAEIFSAQKLILQDDSLRQRIIKEIEGGLNAEAAITRIFDFYEEQLRQVDNEYIRDRASDIGEMRARLLDVLRNTDPSTTCSTFSQCQKSGRRIIVADELTPGMTIDLDGQNILGFVTERGGLNSHAAILARAMGIPAVSGLSDIQDLLLCGTEILIDGDRGEVIIWPSDNTLARLKCDLDVAPRALAVVRPIEGFVVMANISLLTEIEDACHVEAEGIGLYRTEFEFMARGRALTEDEQYENYSAVLKAMKGKPVHFRLLDFGGDKPADFLHLPQESNPYLGYRGGRLLLGQPELLKTQARALARAAAFGPVNVMYPMIVDCNQFVALREIFHSATRDIPCEGLKHGVMFEVPAACLQADAMMSEADFGSIGTNDLTQYLYAVDRDNALVAYDYNPDRAAFWDVMKIIVQAARTHNKPLSVCGEMAGEAHILPKLIDIGIRSISISCRLIPQLRQSLQQKSPSFG